MPSKAVLCVRKYTHIPPPASVCQALWENVSWGCGSEEKGFPVFVGGVVEGFHVRLCVRNLLNVL